MPAMYEPDEPPPVEFHRSTRIVVLVAFLLGLVAMGYGAFRFL